MKKLIGSFGALLVLASGCGGGGNNTTTGPGCSINASVLAQCVPGGNTVTLNVIVIGGSSVEFYDNQNVRHRCYEVGSGIGVSSCTATYVVGSEARIQRELSLPVQNETQFRLSDWMGACQGINASTEPRGGQCRLTMDANKNVTVRFEQRAKVNIQQVLQQSGLSVRWMLAYSTQKAGGNSSTRAGTFDCNSPSGLPYCTLNDMYYDVGTILTVTAGSGTGGTPAFWKNWGGACASFGTGLVCTLTLTGDVSITGTWSGT